MTRILVVTHTPPWPTTNGGHQRTNLLMRALKHCGDVDLLLLPRSPAGFPIEALEHLRDRFNLVDYVKPRARGQRLPWSLARPLWPKLIDFAASKLGCTDTEYIPDRYVSPALERLVCNRRYDAIVGRYLQPTALSGALAYRPVILDVDDLDTERCRTELAMPGNSRLARWILRRRLRQLEHIVPRGLAQAAHLWVCTEADRARVGSHRATVLPNIPFVDESEASSGHLLPASNGSRMLIVGSFKYGVNVRGVDRFLRHAWPLVRRARPEARLRVVGAGLSDFDRERWSKVNGVEPVGFVEDLQDEYAAAAFTVAPLFEGAGTKIKVLESLAHGRTCVTSHHVQQGFEPLLRHLESLWSAEDDEALADGCIALLDDPAQRDRLAETGYRLVREHYTFDRFREIVQETLRRLFQEDGGGLRKGAYK